MKMKIFGSIVQPLVVAIIGSLLCLLISFLFAKFGNNLPLSYKTSIIGGATDYVAFGIKLTELKNVFTISFDTLSYFVSFGFIYLISFLFIGNFIFFGKKNKKKIND